MNSLPGTAVETDSRRALLRLLGHEVRNCLNGVLGLTEVMKMSAGSAEAGTYAQLVHQSATELNGLVESTLDLALAERGTVAAMPSAVELRPFVAGIASFHERLAVRAGVHWSSRVEERLPANLRADRRLLALALHSVLWQAVRGAATTQRVSFVVAASEEGARFCIEFPQATGVHAGPLATAAAFDRAGCEDVAARLGGRFELTQAGGQAQAAFVLPMAQARPNG